MAVQYRHLLPWLLFLVAAGPLCARERYVDYVDPFIGTDGTGHTFPGPSCPFGMVQPGPDNADHGWDYTSGYQYRAPLILGFSQTRASGTGIPELGDVLLMPMAARRDVYASHYDKASETARTGYYAVSLTDNEVRVELTAGVRVAMHRYTFAHGGRVWVLADFQHGLRFVDGPRVTRSLVTPAVAGIDGVVDSANWTRRTVAFALRFDHPVLRSEVLPAQAGDRAPRYLLAFDLGRGRQLKAKVALSSTDVEGARRNLGEVPGWDFDAEAAKAAAAWERQLGRVEIVADRRTKRIFYTALYHAFLHPSVLSDVDGRYRGPTGGIARARGRNYYSTLSLWDTFRAAQPLDTLLASGRVDDFILTLLDHARAQGYLPLWPIWGGETHTMIGNPALPVIAGAWARGFRGFDGHEALAAMVHTASVDHPLSDWTLYDRYGYYPFDKVEGEAVSRTLEAGIGDSAVAGMAVMLGDPATAARFAARAQSYRQLVDPQTRLMRGKDSAGHWRTPFDPMTPTSPLNNPGDYTEANAWQYSWTPALHDPEGLVAAMGGRRAFTQQLDRFFALPAPGDARFLGQEALIGQYAHGNEPSHHIAWLYAYSDEPARGPELVARIAHDFYRDTPAGIIGNEDAGQMSAWYVFATLGFYPANPASGRYVLGVPLVSRAVLHLAGGRQLLLLNDHPQARPPWPRSVTLNGRPVHTPEIAHADLARGGTLQF
jgi:predicted alpha-1,2-mannosidase